MWRPRLLVVDDDEDVANLVCRVAEDMGFKTCSANGTSLSSEYEYFEPDVIVLDIMMPEIDGFEVLRYIGASQKATSVIIISGTKTVFRKMAERMGAELGLSIIANVSKPFTITHLQEVFEQARKQHPAHAPISFKKIAYIWAGK